jgi:hypothetical protein
VRLTARNCTRQLATCCVDPLCASFSVPVLMRLSLCCPAFSRTLTGRCLPRHVPVDLVTVCFAAPEHNSPDRCNALRGAEALRRLQPERAWRVVLVDEGPDGILAAEATILRLVFPHVSNMDFNIGAALWFAARGRGTRAYRNKQAPSTAPSSMETTAASLPRPVRPGVHAVGAATADAALAELACGSLPRESADKTRDAHAALADITAAVVHEALVAAASFRDWTALAVRFQRAPRGPAFCCGTPSASSPSASAAANSAGKRRFAAGAPELPEAKQAKMTAAGPRPRAQVVCVGLPPAVAAAEHPQGRGRGHEAGQCRRIAKPRCTNSMCKLCCRKLQAHFALQKNTIVPPAVASSAAAAPAAAASACASAGQACPVADHSLEPRAGSRGGKADSRASVPDVQGGASLAGSPDRESPSPALQVPLDPLFWSENASVAADVTIDENSRKLGTPETSPVGGGDGGGAASIGAPTSTARVLFSGLGADELLGGYRRHYTAFQHSGWAGLVQELELDTARLWKRNLGRDDRCMSDHGKEARFPFLDEEFVAFVRRLPLHARCDPRLEAGVGDKLLLRVAAHALGLCEVAHLPKRAIQFGSRISKCLAEASEGGRFPAGRLGGTARYGVRAAASASGDSDTVCAPDVAEATRNSPR